MPNRKKDILFLINPKSGVQNKRNVPKLIERGIDKSRFNFSIEETKYIAHACELTEAAVRLGVDVVVAVGGDGTVNEVARSLVGSDTALGILPCGSGNGLARHLGIPLNFVGAIEYINNSQVAAVDYGKINGKPFFCTCGVGFDALVSNSFANGKFRGPLGYMHNMLVDWLQYKPEVFQIETETQSEKFQAFLIACGNASQYGNNAYIAPRASMRDGLLSVTILEPFSSFDVPLVLGDIFGNRINNNSHVKTLESRWIKIKRNSPGVVHYDGEPTEMGTDLYIEIVPSGLNVLARQNWDGRSVPVSIYKQVAELVSSSFNKIEDLSSLVNLQNLHPSQWKNEKEKRGKQQ
ncbi:MAG: YegS/Rv2252/BmrU family lipid kinase [Bacteroidaceae bacterium]|nr:YegS/Rv2252/BmrU family lipid kinase [Bacteroidaceae bacterium]